MIFSPGAGDGNRTHVLCLGSTHTAIVLHPPKTRTIVYGILFRIVSIRITMKSYKLAFIISIIFFACMANSVGAQEKNMPCSSILEYDSKKAAIESVDSAFIESFFPIKKNHQLLSSVCHIAPISGIEYTTLGTIDIVMKYTATEFRPRIYVWSSDREAWQGVPTTMNRKLLTVHAEAPIDSVVAVIADVSRVYEGIGSWYAHRRYPDGAATNLFPIGTRVKVTNVQNGKSTLVRITSTWTQTNPKRVIDLVKTAFQKIANPRAGLIRVRIEKI